MKRKQKAACMLCLLLAATVFSAGCKNREKQTRGCLFSWKDSVVSMDQDNLFSTMKDHRLSVLYQSFSGRLKNKDIRFFQQAAAKQDIEVYLLTGDPKWALEETGESMKDEVRRASEINKGLSEKSALRGIIFDIEPYLLEEWHSGGRRKIMNQFASGMRSAYWEAKKADLEVILCIPYYYDTEGVKTQLEFLISSCCDQVAVMNYYRGKEKKHIKTEAEMAGRHDKKLVNIYEFQKPGTEGLTERNTYYNEGAKSAVKNFEKLKKTYKDQEISMAFHDYEALREADGHE